MNQNSADTLPLQSQQRIARETLNDLPIGRYEGPVHLISAPSDLLHAMQDIGREHVIGFDTETRPAFQRGESYLPSLVQIATAGAVYLVQVQLQDYSAVLREILSSEKITKAGVSVANDLSNLRQLFGFEERAVVDLGRVAKRHGMKQTGVRNLAGIFLGTRIAKGATKTNWAARNLTPQQIAYAATDAWICRELYLRFRQMGWV